MLSLSKRQFIGIAENEAVSHIKIGVPILPLRKTLISKISRCEGAEVGAGCNIESMTVGIGGLELQTMRQTLLETGLQGVVIGECIRTKGCDGGIECLVAVIGTIRIRRGRQLARTGARERLLDRTAWSKGRS